MAEEWYLLKSPHVTVSGYGDEAFDQFAAEGFDESLETSVASDIVIYNYDMSESRNLRAVVLGTAQDTRLKSLNRQLLLPIGTCHTSEIVKYKDRYWLIVGLVDNNYVYEKAIMIICNYQLTWINAEGEVIQRWCHIESASQYNNGETASNQLTYTSDQLLILMPDDEDSLMLMQGHRFIIDKRCKYYEEKMPDDVVSSTENYVEVYELTREDLVLFDYQTEGHHEIMVTKTEKAKDDGYYVIDGKGYWLADVPPETPTEPEPHVKLSSRILYDSLEIQNGLDPGIFTAVFYDYKNEECTDLIPYTWEITCEFKDRLLVERDGNSIMISADDWKLSNKTFELSLVAPDYYTQTVTVTVVPF